MRLVKKNSSLILTFWGVNKLCGKRLEVILLNGNKSQSSKRFRL